jgi:hypothetical protein
MKLTAIAILVLLCSAPVAFATQKSDPPVQDKNWEMNEPYWNPNPGQHVQSDVAEDETSNNACPGQPVTCGDVVRPAAITAGDNDYVYFTANAGDVITFGTDADGTPTVDTFIYLYNADCSTQLASDDDSGPGTFSLLSLCAPYTGVYVGRVRGFSTTSAGVYKAFVSCSTSGGWADTCAGATSLPCGAVSLAGNTGCSVNDYSLPTGTASCTGFTSAGRDQVLQLVVAAGAILDLTYTSTADGSIYILDTCTPLHCVAGIDATLSGAPEHLVYTFATAGTYYLILDSFGTNTAGAWTLRGLFDCGTVATQPLQWSNVKALYR